jgi:hypothetical protein
MNTQDKILLGTAEANDALASYRRPRQESRVFSLLQRESQRLAAEVLDLGEAQEAWDGRVD